MKTKTGAITALLALASLWASAAFAGGSYLNETISNVWDYPTLGTQGYVIVVFQANGTGTPNCSSSYKNYLLIDLSTPGGTFAAAMAESAFVSGKTVTADGSGTCGPDNTQFENLYDIHY